MLICAFGGLKHPLMRWLISNIKRRTEISKQAKGFVFDICNEMNYVKHFD
jgi:hypothetical protein